MPAETASFSSTVLSFVVVMGLGYAGFKYAQKKGIIMLENMSSGAAHMKTPRSRDDHYYDEDEEEPMQPRKRGPKPKARVAKR